MNKMTDEDIVYIRKIAGAEYVSETPELLNSVASDETEDLHFLPDCVVFPGSVQEVSDIVRYCSQRKIPVTPRGAGTGLSGGALPVAGGLVISMKRLNRIIRIDEDNLQVTVEPGVITQVLQEAVIEKGLCYPPDPSSRGSCFIGGNLAENSGGPRAVKYGVTKDYVLNLEVVLPSGEIIWTGANVLKNSTGYNLTQLLVGSEGTLGIITKIVLRLIPYPTQRLVMLVPFPSMRKACEAVAAIFKAGVTPSALEFMERAAIEWTLKYRPEIQVSIPTDVEGHLLIEVDGFYEDVLTKECERIAEVVQAYEGNEIYFASSEAEKDALWKLRRSVAEAVKSNSVYKEEDTVVPRYHLPELLDLVKSTGEKYGFQSVCYGHAGDGNLHVNIIKGDLSDEAWNVTIKKGIREIFEGVVKLGGTLSGEHGIGWVQREYMDVVFPEVTLALMKEIKQVFDPNGIMNPGKIFPPTA